MDPDISMAIYSELSFLLKDGWDISKELDLYRVRARPGTLDLSNQAQALSDEVWRIARFVAYANFVSIAKISENSYSINSHMASGDGFEIVLEA